MLPVLMSVSTFFASNTEKTQQKIGSGMPRFILLCGPAATGKTTFRNKLVKQNPDAVVISSDDIITEWANADGLSYQEAYQKFKVETPQLMDDIAAEAFAAGREVIWDQTHLTREVRAPKLAMAPDEYERVAVGFTATAEFLKERSRQRFERTGKEIPEFVIDDQVASYEFPDFDEGFDQIVSISEPGHEVRVL
jgi:predicted kinase